MGAALAQQQHTVPRFVLGEENREEQQRENLLLMMYKARPRQLRQPVRDKGILGLCSQAEHSGEGFISLLTATDPKEPWERHWG